MEQVRHSIIVEIHRGQFLESFHQVEAVVHKLQDDEFTVFGQGDRMIFPRSTLKFIQALPLVELFRKGLLSESELAISCASHRGEALHLEILEKWMHRIGLQDQQLTCGFHLPGNETEIQSFFEHHGPRSKLFNNCAGKHLGFCHWSLVRQLSAEKYWDRKHASQVLFFDQLKSFGIQRELGFGIDGCGVPNPALSLKEMARIYAHWLNADGSSEILQAVRKNPLLISGSDGLDTWILKESGGELISKTGAEGVYLLIAPAEKIVAVIKALDGNTRGSQATLLKTIQSLQLGSKEFLEKVNEKLKQPIVNWSGERTGQIQVKGVTLN